MNKCSPIEMRKNLEVVESLKNAGIDFVCIPVKNESHKDDLIAQGQSVFDELCEENK
jgi:sulfopyruvate decarboxylase TPP-binding subunit